MVNRFIDTKLKENPLYRETEEPMCSIYDWVEEDIIIIMFMYDDT